MRQHEWIVTPTQLLHPTLKFKFKIDLFFGVQLSWALISETQGRILTAQVLGAKTPVALSLWDEKFTAQGWRPRLTRGSRDIRLLKAHIVWAQGSPPPGLTVCLWTRFWRVVLSLDIINYSSELSGQINILQTLCDQLTYFVILRTYLCRDKRSTYQTRNKCKKCYRLLLSTQYLAPLMTFDKFKKCKYTQSYGLRRHQNYE